MRYDGLAGLDIYHAVFVLDAQHSAQHDRDFFEIGPLAGLQPS
jgi:hypothetical protein